MKQRQPEKYARYVLPIIFAIITPAFVCLGEDSFHDQGRSLDGGGVPKYRSEYKVVAVKDCDECPEMILIESRDGKRLFVGQSEVTWREYSYSVRDRSCPLPDGISNSPSDFFPVTHISPLQFECYLEWLREKTGKSYRLPTSEEWTGFAEPPAGLRFPWGDTLGWNHAVVWGHYDPKLLKRAELFYADERRILSIYNGILQAKSFQPDQRGLYDTVGNVPEYVANYRPGIEKCIQIEGEDKCRLITYRGGGVFDKYLDQSFIQFVEETIMGLQQPIGFRIVRGVEQ